MCGIAGIVTRDNKIDIKEICEEMLSVIEHRGPDDCGIQNYANVSLGHRRLSILDLSSAGKQPMDWMQKYTITFNGEIYNYIELREELLDSGYTFYTQTDTEVILASYDHWGYECLNRFNGMWSFAIYDRVDETIFCARDRFGVKPFYYYQNKDTFVFASEIKQIIKVFPEEAIANTDRIWKFLCNGITEYGRDTFYKNIMQLSPGTYGVFDIRKEHWELFRYYTIAHKNKKYSYKQAVKRFKELFLDSIKLRMRADVSVGSCLSGGLDSSSIVCGVHELYPNKKMKTVSSCYDNDEEKQYDEREYIDEVINATEYDSYRIFLRFQDAFNRMDKIIWHMDEPFTTTSIFAQYFVFEEAKKRGLKVMLDGQGADEQLGGYTSFYMPMIQDMYKNKRFISLWYTYFRYHFKRKKTEIANTSGNYPEYPFELEKGNAHHLYNSNNYDRFTLDMININLVALLHYEDRNSMAHSIESRVPFLDYRLVDLMYDMPSHFKMHLGFTKAILRDAMRGILPSKIRLRISKLGFATPETVWFKNNHDFILHELEEACKTLNPLLERERVLEWFETCYERELNDFFSFRIICLAHWVRVFNIVLPQED